MPGFIKVLVSKHDKQDYRGVRVKRTTVTAIECISGDGKCWELGTANQSDRLGDHVIRGRNDLSAKSTCT